jgi:thiol-disulfide isomerase/thioredoxin/sugar lactone lactonase YvrE
MRITAWLSAALVAAFGAGCGAESANGLARRAEAQPPLVTKAAPDAAQGELVELPPIEKRVEIPGWSGATAWLNVDHPITKEELRGRVVVVDFWTSCCINCLHTIPTLHKLEEAFRGQPLVVIGVHSPKFDQEKRADRLRDIVLDNHIEHPVAVDGEMAIWKEWGVEAWPTVAVLDTAGRVIWVTMGEPDAQDLTNVVASALAEGRAQGKLAKGELRGVRREPETGGALRYPGKVLALSSGGLAIADTGHNRIILLDKSGAVEAVVGSGSAGRRDGNYESSSFNRPQGMAEQGRDLYVADTGNHMIRKIDRAAKTVRSVAGTGELGYRRFAEDPELARDTALRSPWDLLAHKGVLYVALAGSHQIGVFDPMKGTVRGFAGSGHEGRKDGDRFGTAFAQPSALATDGKELFVLDSETSSVRAVDLTSGEVRTVVGEDLFVFGDKDGDRETARLQHPIGMAFAEGALWVADTYNSKLKRVDPKTGATRTVLAGALSEPAGLSVSGATAFIADTNHHRIVRYALRGASSVEPVALVGLTPPTAAASSGAPASASAPKIDPADPVAALGTLRIAAGKPSRVRVAWKLPEGTGVNEEAPVKLVWAEMKGLARLPDPVRAKGAEAQSGIDVTVEPAPGASAGSLTGVLELVTCDVATHRVCVPIRRTVQASFTVGGDAATAQASIALPPAK